MSVAAENAFGTVVDIKSGGPTAIAVAVKLTLFLLHHFRRLTRLFGFDHSNGLKNYNQH